MTTQKNITPFSLDHLLHSIPHDQDIWVFAYGSLMWDPGFTYEEKLLVAVHGYQRSFCIKSIHYRGTPDNPGLVLGLDKRKPHDERTCYGLAFRIDKVHITTTVHYLWTREMITNVYKPTFVKVSSQTQTYKALTFIADPDHPHYCGQLSTAQAAQKILEARGLRGKNLSYLEATFQKLQQMKIYDDCIYHMVRAVEQQKESTPDNLS